MEEEIKSKKPKRELFERASAVQARHGLAEDYLPPVTDRERWWRTAIRETPGPGAYKSDTFGDELKPRPASYGFRSDGRRRDPQAYSGKGQLLLPGAYKYQDLTTTLMETSRATYGFRNTGRNKGEYLSFGKKDKDVNVPPDAYETEKYLTVSVERSPKQFWQFKSQSQRLPTIYFKPKEGPGPGCYESPSQLSPQAISAAFKSRTPRFVTSHTKVPGPGSYDSTFQSNMPNTIMKMGKKHGIFFTSAFQA